MERHASATMGWDASWHHHARAAAAMARHHFVHASHSRKRPGGLNWRTELRATWRVSVITTTATPPNLTDCLRTMEGLTDRLTA